MTLVTDESSQLIPVANPSGAEILRALRHEIGDVLQTVYATVAIFRDRLPSDALERELLTNLRRRSELCRMFLDAAQDLIQPVELKTETADIGKLIVSLIKEIGPIRDDMDLTVDVADECYACVDRNLVQRAGRLLMRSSFNAARDEISVLLRKCPEFGSVQWIIRDNREFASPDLLAWLDVPFKSTQQPINGIALAFAQRVSRLHRGSFGVRSEAGEIFEVILTLPEGRDAV